MPAKGSTLGPRLKDEERTDLANALRVDYSEGHSIRELASQRGRSYGLTRALLLEAGTELRRRGGITKAAA